MKTLTLFMVCAALCVGCRGRNMRSYLRISNTALVVIAHNQYGALYDHLAIDDLSSVDEVVVHPPSSSEEVFVTVFGNKLHETLYSDLSIGTKRADGYLGMVTITVENGVVLRVDGNSMTTPSPVTRSTLQAVESYISDEGKRPDQQTIFTVKKAKQESGHVRK